MTRGQNYELCYHCDDKRELTGRYDSITTMVNLKESLSKSATQWRANTSSDQQNLLPLSLLLSMSKSIKCTDALCSSTPMAVCSFNITMSRYHSHLFQLGLGPQGFLHLYHQMHDTWVSELHHFLLVYQTPPWNHNWNTKQTSLHLEPWWSLLNRWNLSWKWH